MEVASGLVHKDVMVDLTNDLPWIDARKVGEAFKRVKDKKAPGIDGIVPKVLKKLPVCLVNKIVDIYKMCITGGVIPAKWTMTKLIFIPKEGKERYDEARSWRPISLCHSC